ncbi:MAG: transcriptional repressor [Geminicoccaceae bacterium]
MSKRGEKLQAKVLAVLRRRRGPLSAYDILGRFRAANPKIAPPTIYRALAALIERGRVHRLESLNAYIACQCDRHQHASVLSICDDCGAVQESVAPDVLKEVSKIAGKSGFAPRRHVIEVHGVCGTCGTGDLNA